MKISFSWSTRREGNEGFVLEQGPLGHSVEFGPMPTTTVLAFVEARRRFVAMMAEKHKADYVAPDFGYMNDPKKKIIIN